MAVVTNQEQGLSESDSVELVSGYKGPAGVMKYCQRLLRGMKRNRNGAKWLF